MSRFDLVIFDCDGVLVDSELITNRIFVRMLNDLGLPVTLEEMFEKFVGRSMPQCLTLIEKLLQKPVPDGFVADYRERTAVALRSELKAVPGIEDVLDGLDIPFCVASSGIPEKIQLTLGVTGLLPRFGNRIFSVVDVEKPKPFPDVFLHAARTCGVPPSRCAVIEDTATGAAAGVAAGMTVFGYCSLTPERLLREAGAHYMFNAMSDLPGLLATA